MTFTITGHDVAAVAKWVGVFAAGGAVTFLGICFVMARAFRTWR